MAKGQSQNPSWLHTLSKAILQEEHQTTRVLKVGEAKNNHHSGHLECYPSFSDSIFQPACIHLFLVNMCHRFRCACKYSGACCNYRGLSASVKPVTITMCIVFVSVCLSVKRSTYESRKQKREGRLCLRLDPFKTKCSLCTEDSREKHRVVLASCV